MTGKVSGKMIGAIVVLSAFAVLLSDASCWALRRPEVPGCGGRNVILLAAEKTPYGISEGGDYGEQKRVTSPEQARRILQDYFAGKDVKIGRVSEKELYYEAEIRDASGKVVDVVIVDKRTGRIRSIY